MPLTHILFRWPRSNVATKMALVGLLCVGAVQAEMVQDIGVGAGGFFLGTNISVADGTNRWRLTLSNAPVPFAQSAVIQSVATLVPQVENPHFTMRFAMPVPPENDTNSAGAVAGVDSAVWPHNHSPGFEILPNGDALAIYFSAATSRGVSESSNNTRFVQARLRRGAEQWDLPELFCDFEGLNDQSVLLWNDAGTLRFFGGGRGASPWLPFKQASSTDNGATWTLALPQLDSPAKDFTPQPIANAFRGADGAMYLAMDAEANESFLWRSPDGIRWHDQGGRTGARHSTIIPLDDKGTLLSFGGKNNSVNGWTPQNLSTDNGVTWSSNLASVFPALGGNQRPSLIRLANGHLFYASDSYIRKSGKSPDGWALGQGAFVAISTNNGADWQIKNLPVTLPHHEDRQFGTLGYVTARQAPDGVIHVLTTMTQPCAHYELNEAWVFSDAAEVAPETTGGTVKEFSERYANGRMRSEWSARICPQGRYLLEGRATEFYPDGRKQHQASYVSGRKTGAETFWAADGKIIWRWKHDLKTNRSVWTQFWPNGKKKLESTWNTRPTARDLPRQFFGLVAHGPVTHWDESGAVTFRGAFAEGQLITKEAR